MGGDSRVRRTVGQATRVSLVARGDSRHRISPLLVTQKLDVTAYSTIERLIDALPGARSELVVVRLQESDKSPARRLETLVEQLDRTPLVVVCDDMPRWILRKVLRAGVTGIVFVEELTDALGPCLRAVLAGQICVPRQRGDQIEPPVLSSREKQVLGLVVMGLQNSQIAQRLYLAESTVKSHLSSAFGKLGVRSRNEAVELIVDPERGFGTGILALGGEPLTAPASERETRDEVGSVDYRPAARA